MAKKIEIQKDKQNSRLRKDRNARIQKDRDDLYCRKRYKSINVSKKIEIHKDKQDSRLIKD